MFNSALKSWRTTLAGWIAAIAMAAPELELLLDQNPATMPDWNIIFAALGVGLGLTLTRDNAVSSEKAGANKPPSLYSNKPPMKGS